MKDVVFGVGALLAAAASGFSGEESPALPAGETGSLPPEGKAGYGGKVVELQVTTNQLRDLRKFESWKRVLEQAEQDKARAVLIHVKGGGLGGYLEETRGLMQQVSDLSIPTYSLVEGEVLGAAAMVAISTGEIYMAPDSVIGGAGVSQGGNPDDEVARKRTESLLLAKVRTVASRHGHNVALIQAMMASSEQERQFGAVTLPGGSVLTLTAEEAVSEQDGRPLLARAVVRDVSGVLARSGLSEVERVRGDAAPSVAVAPSKPGSAGSRGEPEDPEEQMGGEETQKDEEFIGKLSEESFKDKLVVLKVGRDDLVNKQSFKFWRRMLRRAEAESARAVVFDLDTPGGYAYETKEIMSEITRLKIPSYAFVNENAISAGALMSVATDGIYMSPDGTIGAAGLVSGGGAEIEEMMRKKLHSVFEAQIRSVAERKGYDPELIRAMMIPEERDRVFGPVVVKAGELLTLTAREATSLRDGEPLLAKGVVGSIEEIVELEGMEGVTIVRAEPTPFESFAWWVSRWSFVLILVGMAAAYAELKAPGFGVGGVISLLAFGMFFFGNYMAGNLANYELVALFILGVILLAVEILIIPGTGVTGILGVLCMLAALLFGPVDKIDWDDWKGGEFAGSLLDLLRGPALTLGLGLLGGCILILILMRLLPESPVFRAFIVKKELAGGASLGDASTGADLEERVGWTGESLTDLRPSGKASFSGRELDVIANGAFIRKGSKVRILEQDGMKVVVGEIDT